MKLETVLQKLSTCFLKLESGFEYGSQGRLLLRNIENLWFHQCVTTSRYNVFLTGSDKFSKTIQDLKDANIDTLPFGLAAVENSKLSWNESLVNSKNKAIVHKVAKVVTFCDGTNAKDLFHKKQRERKAWWRKIVQQPSRFFLTEAKKGKNNESIDIRAEFPFGNITVETINYQRDVRKIFLQDKNCNDNDNDISAVEHVASLDWGCLVLLCDSFKETTSCSELQLQPKIAPYKAICKVNLEGNESESIVEDLNQLVLYINNLLRSSGLGTVLINDNLFENISKHLHVPFIIGVDKVSLKSGIVSVTSHVTTLAESVHVSQLIDHIASNCK
ncbi:DNA polymerase subunit gamma-2, mitochondrial-like [Leptopilina heterotoma]|uniref:DNA polymerase subunit gamma-2, mitochondrial-like n=1 Tax=Leptopilina heterotoma TaxID=63436 RepID=UPI001CA8914A|nr:DNA polymerase subunit gamma-2, mitochondrial-like [Leptopilina heterotoma]